MCRIQEGMQTDSDPLSCGDTGYRGDRKSKPPERVAIRAAKSEGALPPFRDEPSDHGLDGRVFEAYLCFRGAASISDLPANHKSCA